MTTGKPNARLRISHLTDGFLRSRADPLQVRLYRMVCLVVGSLCLLVILPANLLQNLPIWVHLANSIAGVFGCFMLWHSLRGRHYFATFYLGLILILDAIWFINGGSNGSVAYYFFALALYPVAIFRGRIRWSLIALLAGNACALLFVEYLYPTLARPFKLESDRYIDLASGMLCAGLGVIWVIWLVMQAYDREQAQLRDSLELSKRMAKEKEAALREAQAANAKLRELEGTFQTICAWTHRIKDDGEWITLEQFLERHLKVQLTHGISPEGRQMVWQGSAKDNGRSQPSRPADAVSIG